VQSYFLNEAESRPEFDAHKHDSAGGPPRSMPILSRLARAGRA